MEFLKGICGFLFVLAEMTSPKAERLLFMEIDSF